MVGFMFTDKTVALPVKQRALRGRRLVAVDIENVVGGAVLDINQAKSAWSELDPKLDLLGDEQIVVGVSHIGAIDAWRARPDARLVVRSGEDGADLGEVGREIRGRVVGSWHGDPSRIVLPFIYRPSRAVLSGGQRCRPISRSRPAALRPCQSLSDQLPPRPTDQRCIAVS